MDQISMAIASLGAAKDLAKGFLALKDEISRQQLLIDLQGKILDAQGAALDAQETQRTLLREVEELKSQIDRANDQTAVIATMERDQAFYFRPGDLDPLCPRCIEVDKRLVHVKKSAKVEQRRRVWGCPACRQEYLQWGTFKNAPSVGDEGIAPALTA